VTGAVTLCYAGWGVRTSIRSSACTPSRARDRAHGVAPPHCPPDYVPQLATLVDMPPSAASGSRNKYDGYRIGARVRKGHVSLFTRNGNDWTRAFPGYRRSRPKTETNDALIDGEGGGRAARRPNAASSRCRTPAMPQPRTLVYFVFDLLRLDAADLERCR